MTRRNILQTLALLLFLVVLPLGSWYYLKRGADYRIEMIHELGNFARLDGGVLRQQLGEQWPPEDWPGKAGVWAFVPHQAVLQESMAHYLAELTDQFEEKGEEVVFYLIPVHAELDRQEPEDRFQGEPWLERVRFCQAKDPEVLATDVFELPLEGTPLTENPYLVLTDSLTVKRYYDVREPQQMARLVEHIVFLIPAEEQVTELKREPEK